MSKCNERIIIELERRLGSHCLSGESYRFAVCPFCLNYHFRNRAFSVSLEKQSYYCHDCQRGGRIDDLLGQSRPSL